MLLMKQEQRHYGEGKLASTPSASKMHQLQGESVTKRLWSQDPNIVRQPFPTIHPVMMVLPPGRLFFMVERGAVKLFRSQGVALKILCKIVHFHQTPTLPLQVLMVNCLWLGPKQPAYVGGGHSLKIGDRDAWPH